MSERSKYGALPPSLDHRKVRRRALGLHGPVPALSSLPTAKNAEEFWLGNYDWGVAKNVNDGEPTPESPF